jgi:hypothetical protein
MGRGIAQLLHDHGTRRGEWSAERPGHILPWERPITHCIGGWGAPGPVWRGGKSRPTGIRSPDSPARSQSLYRLSYPAHDFNDTTVFNLKVER